MTTSDNRSAACAPEVGQVWQRKPPHRQRLRVERVWTAGVGLFPDDPTVAGQTVVLLTPVNGGREIVSTIPELHDNATPGDAVNESAAPRHKWVKAPRSLLAAFVCSVCGRDSMVKHYGRCSGGR